ncbi:MAG: hypothetical protein OK457_05105 [Thaumarchaeota archaeon]|nr:hypothetical protein [Nitrososphaerota archaeon]
MNERFRFVIILAVLVFLILIAIPSLFGHFSLTDIFALSAIYIVAIVIDRIVIYMAFRKVPLEAYYQDESHY